MKIAKFTLSENVSLETVEIPGGSFLMGSGEFEKEKRGSTK